MEIAQGYAHRPIRIYAVEKCGFFHFVITLGYPFCPLAKEIVWFGDPEKKFDFIMLFSNLALITLSKWMFS